MSPGLESSLTPTASGSNQIAECVQYGDGTRHWGPIKLAKVTLGGESPVTVPIQEIDATFSGMNSNCLMDSGSTTSSAAGMNGILGVGLFQYDCGFNCATNAGYSNYYGCSSGGQCAPSAVSLNFQVQNPVALLSTDNNGVILKFPDIPASGVQSVDGYLVLGIGTQNNNIPESTTRTYFADTSYGEFITSFNGKNFESFIDSGTNLYAFPYSGTALPDCGGSFAGFFCPTTDTSFAAITQSASSDTRGTIPFTIGNFVQFLGNYSVSKTIGVQASSGIGGLFDWGLPFYIGRNTYHGIEGKSSSLGAGPYWAY
jgi:hypothetical protein